MKKLLVLIVTSFFLSLSFGANSPWKPRNKSCTIMPNGDVVKVKTKSGRVITKRYRNGEKIEEKKTYRDPDFGKLDFTNTDRN